MSNAEQGLLRLARVDVSNLAVKDASYGSSWRKRGGVGAFMMMARKFDRLELSLAKGQVHEQFHDGDSVANDVRDLRRYGLLVLEARSGTVQRPTDWIRLRTIAEEQAACMLDVVHDIRPDAKALWDVARRSWLHVEAELQRVSYDAFTLRIHVDTELCDVVRQMYAMDYLWLTQPPEHQLQNAEPSTAVL